MWDDVESDLSAFHRIDDPLQLPGWRLMKLAARLPAYSGAVKFRLEQIRTRQQQQQEQAQAPVAPPPPVRSPDSIVNRSLPAGGGGAGMQPLPKHSYTEMPEILLPGPQIPGAEVVPATQAALAISEMGHLFSFATV